MVLVEILHAVLVHVICCYVYVSMYIHVIIILQQVLVPYDPKARHLRVDKNICLRVYCRDKARGIHDHKHVTAILSMLYSHSRSLSVCWIWVVDVGRYYLMGDFVLGPETAWAGLSFELLK